MEPWIARAVMLAAGAALVAIRAPHARRSRKAAVSTSCRGIRESILLTLMWSAFFIPVVWMTTPAFSFAEYPLRADLLIAGIACLFAGLWLFYHAHADLGANWSVTLKVRQEHRLITNGVYRRIRHPMYTAFLVYSVGQALVIPNWVAGPSCLVVFAILFTFRVGAEERMMLAKFGDAYAAYMLRAKRLVPGVW
jgi:protein-S-isoprenylcysteine O-methyltransferase Ste14